MDTCYECRLCNLAWDVELCRILAGDALAHVFLLVHVSQRADDKLKSLRYQIMFLLGSLGGQVTAGMVDSTSLDERCRLKAVAWDTSRRLEFAVPFPDMKPSMFLDPFLPRVCELAVSSSDRQTKVRYTQVRCLCLHQYKSWEESFLIFVHVHVDSQGHCTQIFKKVVDVRIKQTIPMVHVWESEQIIITPCTCV